MRMKFKSKFIPNKTTHRQMRANQAWAVDLAILDLPHRPVVMLVIDVGTRLPLSATVTPSIAADVVATLKRPARRSKRPDEDRGGAHLRLSAATARQHG